MTACASTADRAPAQDLFLPDDVANLGSDQVRGEQVQGAGLEPVEEPPRFGRVRLRDKPFDRHTAVDDDAIHQRPRSSLSNSVLSENSPCPDCNRWRRASIRATTSCRRRSSSSVACQYSSNCATFAK